MANLGPMAVLHLLLGGKTQAFEYCDICAWDLLDSDGSYNSWPAGRDFASKISEVLSFRALLTHDGYVLTIANPLGGDSAGKQVR